MTNISPQAEGAVLVTPRLLWSPLVMDLTHRSADAPTESIEERPIDRVFGAGHVPPSEWYFAQPLFFERSLHFPNERRGFESYEERVARGAA